MLNIFKKVIPHSYGKGKGLDYFVIICLLCLRRNFDFSMLYFFGALACGGTAVVGALVYFEKVRVFDLLYAVYTSPAGSFIHDRTRGVALLRAKPYDLQAQNQSG